VPFYSKTVGILALLVSVVGWGQPILTYADRQLRVLWKGEDSFTEGSKAFFSRKGGGGEVVDVIPERSFRSVTVPEAIASDPQGGKVKLPDKEGRFSFRGIPRPDNQSQVIFTALSDTHFTEHTNKDLWEGIGLITDPDVQFFVHAGDVVDEPRDCAGLLRFVAAAETPLARRPVIFARGNHDVYWDDEDRALKHSPFLFGDDHGNQVVHTGPIDLIILDSNMMQYGGRVLISAMEHQINFLKDSLAKSQARWKVVVLHHAPFPLLKVEAGAEGVVPPIVTVLQEKFVPIFESGEVTLVISGHNHIHRQQVVRGVNYLSLGTLGGKEKSPKRWPPNGHAVHSFEQTVTRFTFGPSKYSWRTETLDGRLIQTGTLP
jgi:predicted phosphodiesterase